MKQVKVNCMMKKVMKLKVHVCFVLKRKVKIPMSEKNVKNLFVAFIFFKPVMSKRIPEVEYMCQHCRRSDAEDYLHRYTIDYINKVNPYVFNIPNEYEDGDLDEIFIYLIHT